MASEPYVAARFKLRAEFATGDVFDDIVSMSASFALNTIPTASLVVAVGNRVTGSGGMTKATIHDAKKRLKLRTPVTVTAEILPGGGDLSKLQFGRFTIFKGFYAGIGYQRSHNNANYVLNLIHWLDDLNNSSAINGNWFPGVPFDYANQAAYDAINNRVTSFSGRPSIGSRAATRDNLTTDLWLSVIAPIFAELGDFAGGSVQAVLPPSNRPADRNDAAQKALANMPGSATNYVPLALRLDNGDQNIASSIANYFSNTISESFVQNSIWSKLIGEYAADFLFAISPAVEWALPIPFCGGLRWQPGDKVIAASDYSYASFNANMSQIIESVNVYHPLVSESGLVRNGPPNAKISYYRPCAEYPVPAAGATNIPGLKLFKNAPRWATNIGASGLSASNAIGHTRQTVAPAGGGSALPANVSPPEVAMRGVEPIMREFARHWYMTEILKQRYGEMSGPIRFDIAPGTVVKIEMPNRDRRQETAPDDYLYANIMSVSYVLNAERATAGTSFAIAHTKTEDEISASSQYATDTPPLYANRWAGGPLAIPS
jgi:hypothetical protein